MLYSVFVWHRQQTGQLILLLHSPANAGAGGRPTAPNLRICVNKRGMAPTLTLKCFSLSGPMTRSSSQTPEKSPAAARGFFARMDYCSPAKQGLDLTAAAKKICPETKRRRCMGDGGTGRAVSGEYGAFGVQNGTFLTNADWTRNDSHRRGCLDSTNKKRYTIRTTRSEGCGNHLKRGVCL